MKVRLLLLLFWLALACIPVRAAQPAPEGIVAFCFDGDTFRFRDRRVVRLAGVDAPEIARKDNPAQYYSRRSREVLQSMVLKKEVKLEFPGLEQKDRYGRMVANVILPDGQSLNEKLVSEGSVWFYPHRDLDPWFQEKLRELQSRAILERRGMWKGLLQLPMAREKFTGNRNSLRFFAQSCPEIDLIRPGNRVSFDNLEDAFLAGYAPARSCKFWPDASGQ